MSTPASKPEKNSIGRIEFFTLAGVTSANVCGGDIVAVQQSPLRQVRPPKGRYLCEEFANWPNDTKGVLSFTRRYGPLRACPSPGEEVSFQMADWQADQVKIRREWDLVAHIASKFKLGPGDSGQTTIPAEAGEALICRFGKLEYQTKSLFRLFKMELASIRPERLRKCRCPNCKTPYFVASHLGKRYCTDTCAHWAQREFKKNWWKERGEKWRKGRK